jgi:hypothetical protein
VWQEARTLLGRTRSPAFVRAPAGNGGAERLIRTLQEHLLGLKTFDPVEDLRRALHALRRQDNETWLMGRQGDSMPAQVRHEQGCLLAEAA